MILTACEKNISTHGILPKPNKIASIKVGLHHKNDVRTILGTPSTSSNFDNKIWYYIGSRIEDASVFTPKILDRKVLAVEFDKDGTVKKIQHFDAIKKNTIVPVNRKTPTKGKELTIIQQLIGNVGRFSTTEDDSLGVPKPGGL